MQILITEAILILIVIGEIGKVKVSRTESTREIIGRGEKGEIEGKGEIIGRIIDRQLRSKISYLHFICRGKSTYTSDTGPVVTDTNLLIRMWWLY